VSAAERAAARPVVVLSDEQIIEMAKQIGDLWGNSDDAGQALIPQYMLAELSSDEASALAAMVSAEPDAGQAQALADAELPPRPALPETHYNACGDGSEPLYTPDMMDAHALAYARACMALRRPATQSFDVKGLRADLLIQRDTTETYGDSCATAARVAIEGCIETLDEYTGKIAAAAQPASQCAAPDERVAFEAWAELTEHQKAGAQHDISGWYYFDEVTNDQWEAWQARASLAPPAPSEQPEAKAAPVGNVAGLPGWEHGIATVTMTGHQLREALEFINPDGPADELQCEDELTFGIVQHTDDDGKVSTGLCCWNGDTDGVYPLHGVPAPAPKQTAAPAGNQAAPAVAALSDEPQLDQLSLPGWLRHFAADGGYSHNDYADTMRQAAEEIERLAALLAAAGNSQGQDMQPEQQPVAWRNDAPPQNGAGFYAYHPSLIHPDFNPWGVVEAVWSGDAFIGAKWNGEFDQWDTVPIEVAMWRAIEGPNLAAPVPAAAPEPLQGWQPIETAPIDGSHVWCYAPELQFSAFYAGSSGWCYVAPGVPVAPTQPTHWMPLPAAPVGGGDHG
jgi:hypothetical protein